MQLRAALKRVPFAQNVYAFMRLWRGRNARFAADYHLNSGVGSDLEATQAIVSSLPNVFESLSVRSVLDIPCGDFVYMRQINLGSITYIGADVIEELILSHQRLHESAQKHFRVLDIVTSDLPDVDLVLCRDCLVHFSDRLIKKAVNNIKRSRSRYLLTTTFPEHTTNKAIVTGSWRPLNLCAPPFDFPPPIRLINDGYTAPFEDKSLGLWHVHDLPAY